MEDGRRRHLNYCLSAITLAIALPYLRLIPHVCLFQWLLGIPCPGCGITSALVAVCKLDFHTAAQINVAALPLALLLSFQVFIRPLTLRSSSKRLESVIDRSSRFISLLASCSLCLVWVAKLIH